MKIKSQSRKYIFLLIPFIVLSSAIAIATDWGTITFNKSPQNSALLRVAVDVQPKMEDLDIPSVLFTGKYRLGDDVSAFWMFSHYLAEGNYKFTSYRTPTIMWAESPGYDVEDLSNGLAEGVPFATPLLLDLGRNGFHLSDAGTGVNFDLLATGDPIQYQWVDVETDDAFLFHDLNSNGIVDDGSELFGEGTLMEFTNQNATNGYDALAQFDSLGLGGNSDGVISISDSIWNRLSLWRDLNADGISTVNEIIPLSDATITSFDLDTKGGNSNRRDSAGNLIPFWSWVHITDQKGPKFLKMADIYFAEL